MLKDKYHHDDCTCKKVYAPLMLIENVRLHELNGEAYMKEMLVKRISEAVETTSLQLVIKKARTVMMNQKRLERLR